MSHKKSFWTTDEAAAMAELYLRLLRKQENMPPEFVKVVDDNFFELIGGDDMQEQSQLKESYGPQEDNWKHRVVGMRCDTCMFWVRKNRRGSGPFADTGKGDMGRCRRHAPTMMGFPAVYQTDWCGDHKIDENKA